MRLIPITCAVLGEFQDGTTPASIANELFACAGANSALPPCPQCF